jgi:hypothetical protein
MAVVVRYRNFFIPRVEKNLKISPWDEEISIPNIRLIRKSLIEDSLDSIPSPSVKIEIIGGKAYLQ